MNEPRQQALPVGTRIGVYEIRRVIGVGRFGITYQVWNQHLNAEMALKEYFPRDIVQRAADGLTVLLRSKNEERLFQLGLNRFLEDADKLARAEHPHLERVQNNLQIHGTVYLAMEYEDGIPLSRLIERSGSVLDEEQLRLIFLPIIEALGKVHEVGVLHGDIIPANILLRKSGESVLLDFAGARLALAAPLGASLEVLSEGYAPAEQYDPQGQMGPWSDLYSVGATMYRCVTGNDPLSATDRLADVSKGKSDPQWPALEAAVAGYHENFLKVIDWMLSIRPEDRPQSVGLVLESFNSRSEEEKAEVDEESIQQSDTAVAQTQPNASRQSRLSVSALVLVSITIVLLIGTVLWFSGRDRRTDEILAEAESRRLGSLGRSADETRVPNSTSIPHRDVPERAGDSKLASDRQASKEAVSGSDLQTPGGDRAEGAVDIGSDALAERAESTSEGPDLVLEANESLADSDDGEGLADTSDSQVEHVDLYEELRSEGESEVVDKARQSAESDAEPRLPPMIASVPALEGQAQTEPSHTQAYTPSERDLPVGPSAHRAEESVRPPAAASAPPAVAESEGLEPTSQPPDRDRSTAFETESSAVESQQYLGETAPQSQTAQARPSREPDAAAQMATSPNSRSEHRDTKEPDLEAPMAAAAPESKQSQVNETSAPSEPDEAQTPAQEMMTLPSGESVDSQIEASTLAPQDRIAQHMAAAEEDIKALRLSTPQGDNALEHYQAVLTLDSDHTAAQEGVRHIIEVYAWLIDRAIEEEQLAVARVYLQRAEEIMPQAPELQQARLDLSMVQPAQEEGSAQEAE